MRNFYPLTPLLHSLQNEQHKRAPKSVQHKGVAFYDRQRLNSKGAFAPRPQNVLMPPTGALAEWIAEHCSEVDLSRDKQGFANDPWHEGRFHAGPACQGQQADNAERTTAEYELRNIGGNHPWQVTFPDAVFHFRTLAIAEAAIPELLKIRTAKHPKPTTLSKRATSNVFFSAKRQRELPEDASAVSCAA